MRLLRVAAFLDAFSASGFHGRLVVGFCGCLLPVLRST
jgi:hypothetical protein